MTASQAEPIEAQAPTLPAAIRRIVLTGFMGAGKTTVGRLLATTLGWEFLDLDAHVEARAGMSVGRLFAERGEEEFRRLESSALANALARSRTVVALGGGAVEALGNRLLLEQTPGTSVVYLEAPFPALFDRCMLQSFASPDHFRPLLQVPVEAEVRYHLRRPLFARVAKHSVLTAGQSAAEVAEEIVKRMIDAK